MPASDRMTAGIDGFLLHIRWFHGLQYCFFIHFSFRVLLKNLESGASLRCGGLLHFLSGFMRVFERLHASQTAALLILPSGKLPGLLLRHLPRPSSSSHAEKQIKRSHMVRLVVSATVHALELVALPVLATGEETPAACLRGVPGRDLHKLHLAFGRLEGQPFADDAPDPA